MKETIEIREFKGLFTHADLEDIPKEYLTILKNMRPNNGKLEKTFGIGNKITTALPNVVRNLFTYIHESLTGGKMYIAVYVNPSTYVVTVYSWNGSAWEAITVPFTVTGTYYHRDGHNPILLDNGILRILPGNTGAPDGSNEAKGIWLGYIDRVFFDGLYDPTEAGLKKFYGYACNVERPALTFTPDQVSGGSIEAGMKYYKFSYIYDDLQESLLSDVLAVNFTANCFLEVAFSITKANHVKRIIGMNMYRSDSADKFGGADGIYHLIQSINFLRKSTDVFGSDNGYYGAYHIYVPDLTSYSFEANSDSDYAIEIDAGNKYELKEVSTGTGNTMFEVVTSPVHGGAFAPITADIWDNAWALYKWSGSAYVKVANNGGYHEGTSDSYGGQATVIVDDNLGHDNLIDGILVFYKTAAPEKRIISRNYRKAIKYSGANVGDSSAAKKWKALYISTGLYHAEANGDDVDYFVYDNGLLKGEEHPLSGEASIKVNGEFARIIGKRLWQGVTVLDPGGENEEHEDWISFSELEQYDVNPVGNVRHISDREGGPLTGIAEILGNPVFLKKMSISTLNIKYYPGDPSRWTLIESVHNIGNIAKRGFIEVLGILYVVSFDGIYRISPNFFAEADATPTEKYKISEPIEDTFKALTLSQKESIVSEYDASKNEIIFTNTVDFEKIELDYMEYATDEAAQAAYPANKPTHLEAISEDNTVNQGTYSLLIDPSYLNDGTAYIEKDLTGNEIDLTDKNFLILYTYQIIALKSFDLNIYDTTGGLIIQKLLYALPGQTSKWKEWKINITNIDNANKASINAIRFKSEFSGDGIMLVDNLYACNILPDFENIVFTYNIVTGDWRNIETAINISIMTLDENAEVMVYDDTDNKIYSFGEDEAVKISLKTKTFSISDDREEIVRYAKVTYKSASDLKLNLYTENEADIKKTVTLPVSSTLATTIVKITCRAKKFNLEIVDDVESSTDTEINKILIEHS